MEEKTTKEQLLLNENRRLFNQVSKLNIENKKLVEELEEAKETYENLYESYRSECAGNIKGRQVIKTLHKEHEAFEQAVVQIFGWEALNYIRMRAIKIEKTL